MNIYGQEVYREKVEQTSKMYSSQISIEDIESGVYLIKVESKNDVKVKRLIIQ